jgi:acid ceramidase
MLLLLLVCFVSAELPKYQVDLNMEPTERWKHIVPHYKNDIIELISKAEVELPWLFIKPIKYLSKNYFIEIPKYIGEYGNEIIGISHYTNISLSDMVLYNIFYELFSLCTSFIISSDDTIIHARNLDFGVLMEGVVPLLKKLTIHVDFIKDNKIIFRSHTFAGLVGVFTGMKPFSHSITVNQRFAFNGGYMGIIKWFNNRIPKWNSLIVRELLEGDYDYTKSVYILSNVELIAPIYYIIGGINNKDGALITRERYYNLYPVYLNASDFIFQTNHDHWVEPFYFDDRTTNGKWFLKNNIHNINNSEILLKTKPTLNKITIYGTIMIPKIDYMYGFIQNCEGDCHSINLF